MQRTRCGTSNRRRTTVRCRDKFMRALTVPWRRRSLMPHILTPRECRQRVKCLPTKQRKLACAQAAAVAVVCAAHFFALQSDSATAQTSAPVSTTQASGPAQQPASQVTPLAVSAGVPPTVTAKPLTAPAPLAPAAASALACTAPAELAHFELPLLPKTSSEQIRAESAHRSRPLQHTRRVIARALADDPDVVSGPDSLITGKNTGKFIKAGSR